MMLALEPDQSLPLRLVAGSPDREVYEVLKTNAISGLRDSRRQWG